MTLRSLAAADLAAINADTGGVAEAIGYAPTSGSVLPLSGVWVDGGELHQTPVGVGAEHRTGEATLRLAVADLGGPLDRAAVITRDATGEEWAISDARLIADVAWRLRLVKKGQTRPRGVK